MSSRITSAFSFIDKKDFLHRLDPRTKLIMILSYLILIIMFREIVISLFITITIIPLVLAGKMTKVVVNSLRQMSFLFFFIVFFNTLFISLDLGLLMALRILNILVVFALFFQTTNPDDLSQSMTKLGIPYHIAFTVSLAFRFVPTLAKETETISDAQKSRGLEIERGGIFQQLRNLFPLLVPLISNSIQRAYYIAESLEARSFAAEIKRTTLFPLKIKGIDVIMMIWFIILAVIGIYIRIHLGLLPGWVNFTLSF